MRYLHDRKYGYVAAKAFFETSNENALEMGYADDTFYRQQYGKTMAEENLEAVQLFLNTDGKLILCVNVCVFAGADSVAIFITIFL